MVSELKTSNLKPKTIFWAATLLCLATFPSVHAQPAPVSIEESEFPEIVSILKSGHIDPKLLPSKTLDRAEMSEWFGRLGAGVMILPQAISSNATPAAIRAELLPYRIGYWRLPSFKPAKDWLSLENQLFVWEKAGVIGLVLDVRDFEAVNDFAGAAQTASLFCPPGSPLFSLQGLSMAQQVYQNTRPKMAWNNPIIVVTNRKTTGAAEAFAAILQYYGKVMVLGRSTPGQCALYTETKLKSGRFLRIATGAVALPNGTKLLARRTEPDIPVYADDEEEHQALLEAQLGSTSGTVQELPSRYRWTEQALVHHENPDIDAALMEQRQRKHNPQLKTAPAATRDTTLMRALDILRSIHLMSHTGEGN